MRTTITIDDSLYNKAADLADPHIEKSALLRECVKAYIELQYARRLAALGGTIPTMESRPSGYTSPVGSRCLSPLCHS